MDNLTEVEIVLFAAKRLEEEGYTRDNPTFIDMLELAISLYIKNKKGQDNLE